MGAYMASMWYAVTLKGIAAIAAKALVIGKIALVISAIIGLKKLTHHGGDHWSINSSEAVFFCPNSSDTFMLFK